MRAYTLLGEALVVQESTRLTPILPLFRLASKSCSSLWRSLTLPRRLLTPRSSLSSTISISLTLKRLPRVVSRPSLSTRWAVSSLSTPPSSASKVRPCRACLLLTKSCLNWIPLTISTSSSLLTSPERQSTKVPSSISGPSSPLRLKLLWATSVSTARCRSATPMAPKLMSSRTRLRTLLSLVRSTGTQESSCMTRSTPISSRTTTIFTSSRSPRPISRTRSRTASLRSRSPRMTEMPESSRAMTSSTVSEFTLERPMWLPRSSASPATLFLSKLPSTRLRRSILLSVFLRTPSSSRPS
mmetsp:Transcript_33694/g.44453  ORF Transcript_33694/g.44453 Transcript_33694/m.44453 type:complete len:299 (+) Transcript_33694:2689-3585(+)